MSKMKKKFRKIKKFPTWIYYIPCKMLMLISMLLYRKKIVDPNDHINNSTGVVTVTWHNRLMFFPTMFPKKARKKTIAVISASRDGQYLADLISYFGIKAVRGSSKRGGANALLGATRGLKDGFNISFTPDGPRGPKYMMSRGPIVLASQLQVPIIPLTINASRYWELKSWDNFQIPKPFCKLEVILGDAIYIPANISREEMITYQEKVRLALNSISIDK